jgi:phage gp29-like protein
MDNFNTEYMERLHIEFAKDAYAATNHKDEFVQMATWQERKENVTVLTGRSLTQRL